MQMWYLSNEGEIRRDEICLDYSRGTPQVINYRCHGRHGNQYWKYLEVVKLFSVALDVFLNMRFMICSSRAFDAYVKWTLFTCIVMV